MKYIALFLLFVAIPVYAELLPIELQQFETVQQDNFMELGKYRQYKVGELAADVEIWVYETPDKEVGYQVIQHTDQGISSLGYGAEAFDRTYIIDKNFYEVGNIIISN